MYEGFYGLRERPFDLTPNPRFLFMTAQHREALTTLEYGLSRRTGIALLVGDAGTGKTTIVHAALQSQSVQRSHVVYLNNPALTRGEFIEFLAAGFDLSAAAASSKTRLLAELTEALATRHAAGTMAALIIDEAQCLPDGLLEEIRLLANIESASEKLLSILLVGQPELGARLNQPSHRQLKQRIGLRGALPVLTREETAAYISARIQIAGGNAGHVFTPDAMAAVHRRAGGIPRTISVICDNSLVAGFAMDQRPVECGTVLGVCDDFEYPEPVDRARDEDDTHAPGGMLSADNDAGLESDLFPAVADGHRAAGKGWRS
jgi:general secretion pathway protein A